MIRSSTGPSLISVCLLLGLLSCQHLNAQRLEPTLTLNAWAYQYTGPRVHSLARGIAFDASGARFDNLQIILGHRVWNVTTGQLRYQGHVVREDGYADSDTGFMIGDYLACFGADMVIHVNAFNFHRSFQTGVQCTEIVQIIPPEIPEENCPVLLDLQLDGFHLSGPDPAVSFDIDADGTLDQIAWTKAGEDDAFLCLDRNGNGVIDDGRELFGFATPLLSGGTARVGYRALADLDRLALGGNQDGKIDASDAAFSNLCAWLDANRDGISQPEEMRMLDQVGVVSLDYGYRTTHLRDSFGNLFRYVSRVTMRTPSGALRPWVTFDVIFAEH